MRWIKNKIFSNQNGVATIEFSITIVIFITLMLFVAEMSRIAYVSSVIDLAVSEAAKEAKNSPVDMSGDYQQRFKSRLNENGGSLWRFLTSADATDIQVKFATSVSDMITTGGSGYYLKRPLARYRLSYNYHPMFFPFPNIWANNLLTREVIFVQEYERSKFIH